ncbi:MAG: HAD hydrolase-like protein [Cyclobacteriaceae bacterium]|nr:HAD hydrolase-like protein [Cyclobacteriaceae bacterium]
MTKLPELIVFDLAGTTVKDNRDVHRVLQMALEQYHVPISLEDANEVMGIPKPVAIEKLLQQYQHPDIRPELIADIHEIFVKSMIDFYRFSPEVGENEGVSDTFRKLKDEGIRVAVDTGFDRPITNALLERMQWREKGLIDASATSDEVERGRPYPDLILRLMEVLEVKDASAVAKVGDTASDMQEGKSAGCGWVIGITSGAFSREELQKENPTHLISSVPEILAILDLQ